MQYDSDAAYDEQLYNKEIKKFDRKTEAHRDRVKDHEEALQSLKDSIADAEHKRQKLSEKIARMERRLETVKREKRYHELVVHELRESRRELVWERRQVLSDEAYADGYYSD